MAKPRIFLSSTCYDLSIVRRELTSFLENRGFEVINSEKHSFGVTPGKHSHTACLDEVENADYLILLIGKRRGGTYIGSEKSITNEEYNRAVLKGIPTIVCVLREVEEYRITYKKNPTGDHSHIVDDTRIFHFIDYIASGHADNWIHKFEDIDDLRQILTTQFAHYLYLYSQSLRPSSKNKNKDDISIVEFPANLDRLKDEQLDQDTETALRNGLKHLYDVLKSIKLAEIKEDAKLEKFKCLWIFGRYGELTFDGMSLEMEMDQFKQYAWSFHKAKRVFNQFKSFNVIGDIKYAEDYDETDMIYITFKYENEDRAVAMALKDYVGKLLTDHPDDNAYDLFRIADMRCYMKI